MFERGVTAVQAARVLGISRKTAQKWKARARDYGRAEGLKDRSRARLTQRRFEGVAEQRLIELRRHHPTWGPVKLLRYLHRKQPWLVLPAASTLGDKLKSLGLVQRRKRRPTKHEAVFRVGETPAKANERWTIDFKGHFRLGNGQLCYPLTIRDAASRMVLVIEACADEKTSTAIAVLEKAFKKYGLPGELHSDNGEPFGSTGIAGFAELSVYALRLGVRPVFSRPAKPQDNGAHERMHRDLKVETAWPPAQTFAAQQRRFDAFRKCFNNERPHEGLKGRTPASRWRPSRRRFPDVITEPAYPRHWESRVVDVSGHVSWLGVSVPIGRALRRQSLGLEPIDEGMWRLHFMHLCLGLLHQDREETVVFFANVEQIAERNLSPM